MVHLFYLVTGNTKRNKRQYIDIALLAYKQYNDFETNTQLLPPLLIIPVFIGKLSNKTMVFNKFSENKFLPLKLLHKNNLDNEENDIDVGFRQSLNRGMGSNNKSKEDETKGEVTTDGNAIGNKTDIINNTVNITEQNETIKQNKNITGEIESTTLPEGLYPASNHNNEYTNSISLTTTDANLPPIIDNRWQNFTVSTRLHFANQSITNEPDSSIHKGPYSAALYNNGMINQISITTNSYTNEESPLPLPKNDRWRTFSQNTQYSANEFKPLAGLYYDGFLHKPLVMLPGFVPRNYYNL